jgi:N-methylhydantoinase B
MSKSSDLAAVHMHVMWNRLGAVVEEQAQTLIRTAFSTAVREAGDLSAGVFDAGGGMIAQAVTGTPGHVNSMALSVRHFLKRFPPAEMREGDVFVTNDPWLSTGHLFDFTVVTPAFSKGRLVAYFAATAHVVDIGGRGFSADARQVFEEGICIPPMPLAQAGIMNQSLLAIIEANVREPVQVTGDLYSLAACNEIGIRRLRAMMGEFALENLDGLSRFVTDSSRAAMLAEIGKLPRGTWRQSMTIDGYERPVNIVAALTVADDGIHVDYSGTSSLSERGINVPLCYTEAYTAFGIRCLIGASIPNNSGSLSTISVCAPPGCILNAPRPAAVSARHAVGQMLPDVMFGCLADVVPGGTPAEGAASLWVLPLFGGQGAVASAAEGASRFTVIGILAGGTGARPGKDGFSATAFPSRVRCVPIEIIESQSTVVFWRKELLADSGGAGRYRGGLGQVVEIASAEHAPMAFSAATCERIAFPARGRSGGKSGRPGRLSLASGKELAGKKKHVIPAQDRLVLELPGGGGFGPAEARDGDAIARDVRLGWVTPEAARRDYGWVAGSSRGIEASSRSHAMTAAPSAAGGGRAPRR